MMKKLRLAIIVLFAFAAITTVEYKYFNKKLRAYKKRTRLRYSVTTSPKLHALNSLPKQFENVFLPANDIVVKVKKLDIRNVFAPYNASIIEHGDGYLVFFRYDTVVQMHQHLYNTNIAYAEFNKNFQQTSKEFTRLDVNSNYGEDPRAVVHNGEISVIYNNLISTKSSDRAMHLARLSSDTLQPVSIQKIDLGISRVEKNWAPFIYKNKEGREALLFEYQVVSPRRILNFASGKCLQWFEPEPSEELDQWRSTWTSKWGTPLGGAGARLIDGEYVSFFHSKFKDDDNVFWYVMGAYTFEAEPPFRITGVSKAPIFFEGVYETPALNTAEPQKYVIFPCGFAVEKKDQSTLLHVSAGENDSSVKIITIDKDALLQSLERL